MSKRHQSSRRKAYGRRQHELRERQDRAPQHHALDVDIDDWGSAAPADPFYHRTDISLDFYRAVKEHQGDHLASRTYARAVTAFGLGLLLLALFLLVAGFDLPLALGALWRGAFGSWYAITSATLVRATPLILLGLAFTLGSRGGALNIGMEGQFALGAMASAWAGTQVGGLPSVVALPVYTLHAELASAQAITSNTRIRR